MAAVVGLGFGSLRAGLAAFAALALALLGGAVPFAAAGGILTPLTLVAATLAAVLAAGDAAGLLDPLGPRSADGDDAPTGLATPAAPAAAAALCLLIAGAAWLGERTGLPARDAGWLAGGIIAASALLSVSLLPALAAGRRFPTGALAERVH